MSASIGNREPHGPNHVTQKTYNLRCLVNVGDKIRSITEGEVANLHSLEKRSFPLHC